MRIGATQLEWGVAGKNELELVRMEGSWYKFKSIVTMGEKLGRMGWNWQVLKDTGKDEDGG